MTEETKAPSMVQGPTESAPASDCPIGYGRPPKHSQFKPGCSGNPKGRRKNSRNLKTIRKEFYETPFPFDDGNKVRQIPRILFLEFMLFKHALKGNIKAFEILTENARQLGVFKDSGPYDLPEISAELMSFLGDEDVAAVLEIYGKVEDLKRHLGIVEKDETKK